MKLDPLILLLALVSTSSAGTADAFADEIMPFVESSCIHCHDSDTETRLNFEQLGDDLTDQDTFRQWERVFDRVAKGEMPPQSEPLPDPEQTTAAMTELHDLLQAENLLRQQRFGRVPARRLTRLEYAYTICDLLGIEDGGFAKRLAETLPAESDSGGFDTVGALQRISPLHVRSYLQAADLALDEAINLGPQPPSNRQLVDYPNAPYLETFNRRSLVNGGSNLKKLDDAVALFLDLDYVLRSDHCGLVIQSPGHYRITVEAYAYQAEGPMTLKLIQANPQRVGAELLGAFDLQSSQPRTVEVTTYLRPGDYLYPSLHMANLRTWSGLTAAGGADNYNGEGIAIKSMFVEGPLIETWPPASTQALLVGVTFNEQDGSQDGAYRVETPRPAMEHVKDVVARIAPLAFRRPVRDEEIESFVALANDATGQQGNFTETVRAPLRSILSSPQFLFFGGEPGSLDGFALANRISYFLWRSMPDEELFQLAGEGMLSDPQVLEQQVDRMLDDEKSMRFVQDFVGQWLRLYDINLTTPDKRLYPEFDGLLNDSIPRETELFFSELVKENLSAVNLIDSDFTFLNRRLAEHYDIPAVAGQEMRMVSLPSHSPRGGVLGQASILKITANGTFTSPVKRGSFVLARLLGDAPNPPPPEIDAIEPDTRGTTTIRETLELHRHLESCAKCHRAIDPPGFALESFDPIGGFRRRYRIAGGRPFSGYRQGPIVDASGISADGDAFSGVRDYRQLLLQRKDQVARNLIEQLIVFSTGAEIEFADREDVAHIAEATRDSAYPVRSIIHQVVQSQLMRNK